MAVLFHVISVLPFSAKNAFVTAYLFKIIRSPVKKCRVRFSNYFVFATLSRGNRMDLLSRLFIFSPTEKNKKFTNVFTRNISELAALKSGHPSKIFRFPSPSLLWRWVGRSVGRAKKREWTHKGFWVPVKAGLLSTKAWLRGFFIRNRYQMV